MSNPWDIPPWPPSGDLEQDTLFRAVGASLTEWETVESSLARFFGFLVSPRKSSLPAERAYGSIATARGRLDMLEAALAAFFEVEEKHDTDGIDEFLNHAIRCCRGLGGRRNDIAHGVVLPYAHLTYMLGSRVLGFEEVRPGFCLAPAEYNTNKNTLLGKPRYIYNSDIIQQFTFAFRTLATDVTSGHVGLLKRTEGSAMTRSTPCEPPQSSSV